MIKKVLIAGLTIPIKNKPKKDMTYYENGKEELDFGRLNQNPLEIWILKTLPVEQKESHIIHEITEFINWHYSLNLPHNIIDTISNNFYQTIKDNVLIRKG